jgi:N4-gp56 family major capsid protein
MANELFGTNGLAVEVRLWYEKQLLSRAVPNFVHMKYALQRSIPRHGGKALQFRRMERITTSTTVLVEGTPPSATQGTFTEVWLTVNQYGQFARISDVAIKQSQDDLMLEYSRNFGEAAGDAIDQLVRNSITAGTNVQYVGTNGSRGDVGSGDYLTPAEIREAVRTLARNNVPKVAGGGRYVAIMHPDTRFDFMGDSDVVQAYQQAAPRSESNPLFSGELFDWMGVRFDITSQARIFSSAGLSGADVYGTVVFGESAFAAIRFEEQAVALVVKPLGSSGAVDDPLDQLASVGWKASHASGILDQTRLVRVEHVASISNAA